MTEKEFAEEMERNAYELAQLKEIDDGGSAFPRPDERMPDGTGIMQGSFGMTLRDWFAGQVIVGAVNSKDHCESEDWLGCAEYAYRLADAMLFVRKQIAEEELT